MMRRDVGALMDSHQFIVGMTKALAWPLSAVTLALVFQSEVRRLLARLEHVKAPGVEADFGVKLDKVEEQLPPSVDLASPQSTVAIASVDASLPPDYMIIQAWNEIEGRLLHLSKGRGLGDRRGQFKNALLIANGLKLPDDTLQSIKALHALRNDAVHAAPEGKPTTTDALRFVGLAAKVLTSLPAT
jgi:hypothetical protein